MPFSSNSARYTLLALLSASTLFFIYKSRRLKRKPNLPSPTRTPKLFFISETGTSKSLARRLHSLLASISLSFDLTDIRDYEPEDLFKENLIIIVASTWQDGKPPENAAFFANWLAESADDFRVGSLMLSGCKFAVFGVGSKAYGETFNLVGKDFSRRLRELGASEIVAAGEGDVDGGELDAIFAKWSEEVVKALKEAKKCEENGAKFADCDTENVDVSDYDDFDEDEDEVEGENGENGIVDLEDIAGKGPSRRAGGEWRWRRRRRNNGLFLFLRIGIWAGIFLEMGIGFGSIFVSEC